MDTLAHADRSSRTDHRRIIPSVPVGGAGAGRRKRRAEWREVIGATDPAEAAEGTIRKLYAESKGRNAVHGSDSDENAAIEIAFFFSSLELVG